MNFVQERGYFVEALPEPWNAKDQADNNTALVMVGHYCNYQKPEWAAFNYVKDVPGHIPIIVGCGLWEGDDRDVFIQAGVQFVYDRPFKNNGLEGMVKAALKWGSALRMLSKDRDGFVVAHLYGDKETLSVYKIPRK